MSVYPHTNLEDLKNIVKAFIFLEDLEDTFAGFARGWLPAANKLRVRGACIHIGSMRDRVSGSLNDTQNATLLVQR